jgi:Tfp pilus assembly protein PilN
VSQQINLYGPLFRRQKKVFSAVAMLQAMAVVIVVLAAAYAFLAMRTSVLGIQANDSSQQLKNELERLKVYSARESPAQREKALAERKKQLEAIVQQRTGALRALEDGTLGRAEGYADSLRALARLTMSGVWLTRIEFSEQGGALSITGRATRPALVAGYLERLRAEKALRGQSFASLEIRRQSAEKRPQFVEFVLAAEEKEAKKK